MPPEPRLIPVLDVMGGVVVRAVGGRRDEYQPIESRLTRSTDPVEVARALLDVTGAGEFYVADLDEIADPSRPTGLTARLADAFPDCRVWADQGVRTAADLARVPKWERTSRWPIVGRRQRSNLIPVLGTETLAGPEVGGVFSGQFAPWVAVSIDLRDGRWLGDWRPWKDWGVAEHSDVLAFAEAVWQSVGGHFLILLDVARVGERQGPGTEEWVRRAKERLDGVFIVTGGGVRDWDDVKRLEDAGADAILVASALHDGTLTFPRPGF